MPPQAAVRQASPRDINFAQRQLILKGDGVSIAPAVNRTDPLPAIVNTVGTANNQISIQLKNVGLNKRLLVKVNGTITNTTTNTPTQTLTPLGAANLFSNITLTDLNNQTRHSAASWLFVAASSTKYRKVWGSALTSAANVQPYGYGSNWVTSSGVTGIAGADATIASGATSYFTTYFEIPISYTDEDLRGAIWAQANGAAWYLNLTVNAGLFVGSGGDKTLAMYQSSTASDLPTLSSITVQVYQNYLDQLPVVQGANGQMQTVLPFVDIQTSYQLQTTNAPSAPVANTDNGIPYANQRDFLATYLIYDNAAGTLNVGTDITYFQLVTANTVPLFKVDPYTQALLARQRIGADMPKGMYYFDHRARPINTQQFGNMNLYVNPSSAPAGSVIVMGYEMLAFQSALQTAQALPAA